MRPAWSEAPTPTRSCPGLPDTWAPCEPVCSVPVPEICDPASTVVQFVTGRIHMIKTARLTTVLAAGRVWPAVLGHDTGSSDTVNHTLAPGCTPLPLNI